ncbi:MAG: hypothetical protein M1826_006797 [Phylliscum demangeonii]|nr:MAG: hypothetical protein M1826_006797 [Phylliscum demangeonii]
MHSLATASIITLVLRAAHASQPSARPPIAAPLRDLPWGQLNFLHTTDSHGWHGGHLQEPFYSADWGDYISFATQLRASAAARGLDLLLVDTGDRVEGNGLYDASDPPGRFTSEILKHQQPIDIICAGNHELYLARTAAHEYQVTAPNFAGHYLASNIDIIVDPGTGTGVRVPLAARFRKFSTPRQAIRILAFGFLFDFGQNANNTVVQRVEETVGERWFQDAIRDPDLDLIVVAGHVPVRSPEHRAIYAAIRAVRRHIPIQFFAGHSHLRDFARYDAAAVALESGRFMETIGFMSIRGFARAGTMTTTEPTTEPMQPMAAAAAELHFARRYIDNNLLSFYHHSARNASSFPTELGRSVSEYIADLRLAFGLDRRLGCAPQDYWLDRAPYPSAGSIYTWLEHHVLPDIVRTEADADADARPAPASRAPRPTLILINSGAIRFDIFQGAFTLDTKYIVSPFTTGFHAIRDVPLAVAKKVLPLLNAAPGSMMMMTAAADDDPRWSSRSLASPEQQRFSIRRAAARADRSQQAIGLSSSPAGLEPGYTTTDDDGATGDDTLHAPITYYRVPNCIQAAVDVDLDVDDDGSGSGAVVVVDLVFLEYIEPWVLLALAFLRAPRDPARDVRPFAAGKALGELVAEWVVRHWARGGGGGEQACDV